MPRRPRYTKILQQTSRHYSPWLVVGPTGFISCCDCGLVHQEQYRVIPAPKGRVKDTLADATSNQAN